MFLLVKLHSLLRLGLVVPAQKHHSILYPSERHPPILPMYVIRKHKPWRAASYFPWWHQKCCPRALFLSHLYLPARDVCARALPFGTWQTPSATGESSKRQDWTKWVWPEVTNLHSAKRSIFAKENGIIIPSAFFFWGKKGRANFQPS